MIPGSMHRSLCIYRTAEENPGKPQLGGHLKKAVRAFAASNGVPFLQRRSVGSHSTPGREKKGKGRTGFRPQIFIHLIMMKWRRSCLHFIDVLYSHWFREWTELSVWNCYTAKSKARSANELNICEDYTLPVCIAQQNLQLLISNFIVWKASPASITTSFSFHGTFILLKQSHFLVSRCCYAHSTLKTDHHF